MRSRPTPHTPIGARTRTRERAPTAPPHCRSSRYPSGIEMSCTRHLRGTSRLNSPDSAPMPPCSPRLTPPPHRSGPPLAVARSAPNWNSCTPPISASCTARRWISRCHGQRTRRTVQGPARDLRIGQARPPSRPDPAARHHDPWSTSHRGGRARVLSTCRHHTETPGSRRRELRSAHGRPSHLSGDRRSPPDWTRASAVTRCARTARCRAVITRGCAGPRAWLTWHSLSRRADPS